MAAAYAAIRWILTNSPWFTVNSTAQVYSVTARGFGQDPSRCANAHHRRDVVNLRSKQSRFHLYLWARPIGSKGALH